MDTIKTTPCSVCHSAVPLGLSPPPISGEVLCLPCTRAKVVTVTITGVGHGRPARGNGTITERPGQKSRKM